MIQHTVSFKLKHKSGSDKEKYFLDNSKKILTTISQVQDFEILRQVSKKSQFDFCFSMFFENENDYIDYNDSKTHTEYVRNIWLKEVEDFQELDFVKI